MLSKTVRRIGGRAVRKNSRPSQDEMKPADIRDRLLKELDKIESLDSSKSFSRPAIKQSSNQTITKNSPTRQLANSQTFSTLRTHQQLLDEGLHVTGFQEASGIPDEAVARAFEASLPNSWKGIGAVTSIKAQEANQSDDDVMRRVTSMNQEGNGAHIFVHIHPDLGDEMIPSILSSCTQANCWNRASIIDEDSRKELLNIIAARVAAADRTPFRSEEREARSESRIEASPLASRLSPLEMYWRELASLALRVEAESEMHWEYELGLILMSYRKASPRLDAYSGVAHDVSAVRQAFSLFDPDFEPWTAAAERSSILRDAVLSTLSDLAATSADQLPDPIRFAFAPAIASIVGEETDLRYANYDLRSLPTDLAYAYHPVQSALQAISRLSSVNGDLIPVHQHPALSDLDTAFGEIAFIASHHSPDLVSDFAKRINLQY